MRYWFTLLVAIWLLPMTATAQKSETLRICTYNILKFGPEEEEARIAALNAVIAAIQPDILVVQGINDDPGILAFLTAFAASSDFISGYARNGPDSDNGILFSDKLRSLGNAEHPTGLRNINEHLLQVVATGDTINLFTCHLTGSDTDTDSLARIAEAQIMRQQLDMVPQTRHRIVAGTLNVYTSSEEAFQLLIRVGIVAAGEVFDPIQRNGDWHNDSASADIHTQSTRVRQFGGGASGGMDDRFDFLLLSGSLLPRMIEGTYTTFGNDGKHFNDSINAMPNSAVDASIAQALYDASDHLPVYIDLLFEAETSGVEEKNAEPRMEMDLSDNKR